MRIAGRYELLRELGAGGQGQVFLGRDTLRAGAERVLKFVAGEAARDGLLREYEALSALAHPHVGEVFALADDEASGRHFLVERFYPGGDLAARLGEAPPLATRVRWLFELLQAVMFLHERGLVHGDIKPSNVVLDAAGAARLVDFGLARLPHEVEGRAAPAGTLAFLAPECLHGAPPSVASDLYAFGLVGAWLFDAWQPGGPGQPLPGVAGARHPTIARPPSLGGGPPDEAFFDALAALAAPDPTARPATARAAARQLAGGLPAELRPPLDPPACRAARAQPGGLFGRPALAAALRTSLRRLTAEPPPPVQIVLLAGAPGSGKSAVLDALRRQALLLGYEAPERLPPPDPQLWGRWLGLGEPAFASTLGAPTTSDPPSELPLGPATPRQARAAFVDALGNALLGAAERRPYVLLVDDLAEAPEALVELVTYVARLAPTRERAPRLLCAVTVAAGGAARAGSASGADSAFERAVVPFVDFARHMVEPLDRPAVAEWLTRLNPEAAPPAAEIDRVWSATGGLPALLQAALSASETGAAIRPESAAVPQALRLQVPPHLWRAATARAAALGAAERLGLHGLALLPLPCPEPDWLRARAALQGLRPNLDLAPTEALLNRLDTAAGPAVVAADPLLLAAAETACPPAERRRVARALLRAFAAVPLAPAAQAALAEAAGDVAGALAATLDAAEQAERQGRERETLVRLQHAGALAPWKRGDPRLFALGLRQLTTAARLGLVAECRTLHAALAEAFPARAAESAAQLAAALLTRGEHRAALQALRGAGGSAPPPGNVAAKALAAAVTARAGVFLGELGAARAAAEQGLAQADAGGAGDLGVHLLTSLGLAELYAGHTDAAETALAAAVARLEAGAAPGERAFVFNALGLVQQRRGDPAAARACYERSLAEAEARSLLDRVAAALLNLGTLAQARGETVAALNYYDRAADAARRQGDLTALTKVLVNLANLQGPLGLIGEAQRHLDTARRLAAGGQNALLQAYVDLVAAEVDYRRGGYEAATAHLEHARATFAELAAARELAECELLAGRLALATARPDAAARHGLALVEQADGLGSRRHRALGLWLQAEAERVCLAGRPERAETLLQQALAALGEPAAPEDVWPVHASLALGFERREQAVQAALHARQALAAIERLTAGLSAGQRAAFEALPAQRELLRFLRLVRAPGAAPGEPAGPGGEGRSRALLAEILQINKRLLTETRPERLLETIIDVAIVLTGAERGFLLLPRERAQGSGEDAFQVRVARNIDRETLRRKALKVSTSIARQVFLTGQPLITVDAMHDDRLRSHGSVAALRLRSVLCVPLRSQERSLGVIYIDNRFRAAAFDDAQRERLEAFADQAALALANARTLRELRRANRELQASQSDVERLNRELAAELERRTAALEVAEARLRDSGAALAGGPNGLGRLIGRSAPMRRLFALIERVAPTAVPVLIVGESGTGKELVARAIHDLGQRRAEPLVSINCAALPETLLEGELFGHLRGAFTGADRDRAGLFERAHRGTLFLDELGDMSLAMQAKLLRVIETGEFTRLGDTRVRHADVRLLAATNRDLRQRVRDGAFREDLFYRLNVVQVALPPLRERPDDLPLLAGHFLGAAADKTGRPLRLSAEALRVLGEYAWPGNVRELEAVLTNAAVLCEGDTIRAVDLMPRLAPPAGAASPVVALGWDGVSPLAVCERRIVQAALAHFGGNKRRAAAALGIHRATLYNLLARAEAAS